MSERISSPRPRAWVSALLVAAVVAIFALSMALAPRPDDESVEAFGGTDAAATEALAAQGVEPWFEPIFEPGSGEIESGLFALQAAAGAGVLGFALGNLRGRRAERDRQSLAD
ncbi:energy-coupling factor ABC transporter substrate-binding protein [Luteococcus sp. OSA5]|uniref:energy-coupling factor ABC transporter substrate-binding protein n=1 Tax=Luteococcus sp. OSA5 TaxID=3401630 RepID=UPI003B439116